MGGLRHVPRDYRFREVPKYATRVVEDEFYEHYCQWLAAHLWKGEFPLNEAQREYASTIPHPDALGIAVDLADTLGWLIWDRERLEAHALEGDLYSVVEAEEKGFYEQNLTGDPEIDETFDETKTPEADYDRICREFWKEERLGGEVPHVDIVVRPLLALAVKKCKSPEEAEKLIRFFYQTFNESASK